MHSSLHAQTVQAPPGQHGAPHRLVGQSVVQTLGAPGFGEGLVVGRLRKSWLTAFAWPW